jgi:signal transduction histidine kinase
VLAFGPAYTLYLVVCAGVMSAIRVPVRRGSVHMGGVPDQAAALLLPPPLAGVIGLTSGLISFLSRPNRATRIRLTMMAGDVCWVTVGAATHTAIVARGGNAVLAGIVAIVVQNATNWMYVALGFAILTGEPPATTLQRNLSVEWFYSFACFGLAAALIAHLLDGSFTGYIWATTIPVLSITLTQVLVAGRVTTALTVTSLQASRQSAQLEELQAVLHDLRHAIALAVAIVEDSLDGSGPSENLPIAVRALVDGADRSKRVLERNAGAGETTLRVVSLKELVMLTVPLVQHRAHQSRVTLVVDDMPQLVNVFGDEVLLRELIMNLLINAIEATPVGGRVRIEYGYRNSARPFVSVHDSGPGLPGLSAGQQVVSLRRTTRRDGTGIGLAWCDTIARRHLGKLIYEGSRRSGAIITLILPDVESAKQRLSDPHQVVSPSA